MLEGEIAHLALDPGAVDSHGAPGATERRDDPGDDSVIKLDPANLGEHGCLPCFVGQARPPAPVDARLRMELAMAAVGERPVVAEAPTTHAFEEAREEVHAAVMTRSPTPSLRPPHVLNPSPERI